jgi:hypothetical protein
VKLDELVNDREPESQAGARGVPIALAVGLEDVREQFAVSGVRSSCATMLTNSSFARLACSASARAARSRSRSTARCRSERRRARFSALTNSATDTNTASRPTASSLTVKDGQLDAMTASRAIVASAVASSPQPRPPSQALAITATTNSGGSAACVTGRISTLTTLAASTAAIVAATRAGGVIQDRSILNLPEASNPSRSPRLHPGMGSSSAEGWS